MDNDWMNVDFESTLKDFEYTRMAAQKINRVVTSADFESMDSTVIFQCLLKEMQLVSFSAYLKRYLYYRAEMDVPFGSVDDRQFREIMEWNFEQNRAPHSFTTTSKTLSQNIKRWLGQESTSRSTIFLLGFGLRMPVEDVSEFLIKVLKEEDFDFSDPEEVIYWYCFNEGLRYADARKILEEYRTYTVKKSLFKKDTPSSWEEIIAKKDFPKKSRQYLEDYLAGLTSSNEEETKNNIAYQTFMSLYDRARDVIAQMYNTDSEEEKKDKTYTREDIRVSDLEKVLYSGIPVNESGNLQKASSSLLSSHFQNKRLNRMRIESIIKRKTEVDRFDLITLLFFIYAQTVEPDWPAERYLQFIDEINAILKKCRMMELYITNPYEAFISMCLVSDCPLAVYSEIWEKSYKTEE